MAKELVLVVDDEADILELVRYNLDREGYRVTLAATGEEALQAARREVPDLMVLDLMLPGIGGLDVCRILKRDAATQQVPIIMLTARGSDADVVTGLELGADDYITKPFRPRVLAARVKAVLRRVRQEEDPVQPIVIREIEIHPGRHEVTVGGEAIELTITQFRILHLLARRPGWVFTRGQIVDRVRGEDHPVTDRSVDVHIVSLRRKLGDQAHEIETVRGVGYRFRE